METNPFLLMATPEEMLQTMLGNLKEKTGKILDEWHQVLKAHDPAKHGDAMKVLKGDHGVSHGYANLISQTFFKPELLEDKTAKGDQDETLLEGKEPIADLFLATKTLFSEIEGEVEFAYKKTYISLRTPKKQFALLQPSTKTRVDVGLNLKDVAPSGMAETAGSWNSMVTHRIKLTSIDQVNKELKEWLQKAYDANK